jgi:hypothetical protein
MYSDHIFAKFVEGTKYFLKTAIRYMENNLGVMDIYTMPVCWLQKSKVVSEHRAPMRGTIHETIKENETS